MRFPRLQVGRRKTPGACVCLCLLFVFLLQLFPYTHTKTHNDLRVSLQAIEGAVSAIHLCVEKSQNTLQALDQGNAYLEPDELQIVFSRLGWNVKFEELEVCCIILCVNCTHMHICVHCALTHFLGTILHSSFTS